VFSDQIDPPGGEEQRFGQIVFPVKVIEGFDQFSGVHGLGYLDAKCRKKSVILAPMLLRSSRWFLIPASLFILGSAIVSLLFTREVIHLEINRWHSPFTDQLFRWWTFLGDGWVLLALILLLLLWHIRVSLVLLTAYAISGLLVQLTKRFFFSHMARPSKYFELHGSGQELHLVPGVELHSWYSFPSGHTAAAFAVFFGLSLFLRSPGVRLFLFILAAGVAWSRVYLSQHFLMDVSAGAFFGLAGAAPAIWWIGRADRSWLDQPLFGRSKT
jgi:membrane-associated phospholipid phosphatase